jgi:hypothetical protein
MRDHLKLGMDWHEMGGNGYRVPGSLAVSVTCSVTSDQFRLCCSLTPIFTTFTEYEYGHCICERAAVT